MKRVRLNLVLLTVAAGLGAVVFLAQKKEPAGPPLTAFKPDAVTRIGLEHPGAPAIRIEKQDGHWQLVAPVVAEADEFEVNGLVALADREARALEGGALKELDLDPPQFTLTLNDAAIGFGGVEPLEFRRYVKTATGVSMIEDPPGAAMDKDYADLVSKNALPPGVQIERIELPALTLARGTDGAWTLSPADPKAGADQMQKLAQSWGSARAMWNEMAPAGKASGERVRVTLKGGVVREFVVAAREPQLKLQRPDLGVTLVLSKALADDMLKLPAPVKDPPKTP